MILDDPWEPAEHREKRMNSAYFIVDGGLDKNQVHLEQPNVVKLLSSEAPWE